MKNIRISFEQAAGDACGPVDQRDFFLAHAERNWGAGEFSVVKAERGRPVAHVQCSDGMAAHLKEFFPGLKMEEQGVPSWKTEGQEFRVVVGMAANRNLDYTQRVALRDAVLETVGAQKAGSFHVVDAPADVAGMTLVATEEVMQEVGKKHPTVSIQPHSHQSPTCSPRPRA